MPVPHWIEIEAVEALNDDGQLSALGSMATRHETLEHARLVVDNTQKAFDQGVLYAKRAGLRPALLAKVLGLSDAAVAKTIARAENAEKAERELGR